MIRLVNFSDDKMLTSRRVCSESAMENGVEMVWQQDPDTIDAEFKRLNQDIFKHERGCGYWLWKPYIIYRAMVQPATQEGDILIYADAGVKWIANVNEIISRMDRDIFLFSNGHQHVHWCKGDVYSAINYWESTVKKHTDCGTHYLFNKEYETYQQVQASVIFFKVNENTRRFVKEWLLYCQMPGFIDDSQSKLPNHPEFAEHRHDQAILTCLQIKYGYKLHWWPDAQWYLSQQYRWPDDTYPPILMHHRLRDPGKGEGKNPEWP